MGAKLIGAGLGPEGFECRVLDHRAEGSWITGLRVQDHKDFGSRVDRRCPPHVPGTRPVEGPEVAQVGGPFLCPA